VAIAVSRTLGAMSVYEAELTRRGLMWRLTLEGRAIERRRDVVLPEEIRR